VVAAERGKPEPRVLAQHAQFTPDVRQVHRAGLVNAKRQRGFFFLELAERTTEDIDCLLALSLETVFLGLEHTAGEGERKRADFARAGRVAGLLAVAQRVDVRVGLAQQFVDGGHHQRSRGMLRLDGHLCGQCLLVELLLRIEQEIAVVFVEEFQQRTLEFGPKRAGFAAVVRIGHVPESPFQPAVVVGPQVALGRAGGGAEVPFRVHDLAHVVHLAPHADHRPIVEQRRSQKQLTLATDLLLAQQPFDLLPIILRLGDFNFIIENLPPLPSIFKTIKEIGNVDWDVMFTTFNNGIGLVVVVPQSEKERALKVLGEKDTTFELGKVEKTDDPCVEVKKYGVKIR